jgi:chorismate mutase
MQDKVRELITAMLVENQLKQNQVVSIFFTGTPDISCGFPATALRTLGFADTPLICAQEMEVDGAAPLLVRVLMHVEVEGSLESAKKLVKHQYLHRAAQLRPDISRT